VNPAAAGIGLIVLDVQKVVFTFVAFCVGLVLYASFWFALLFAAVVEVGAQAV
jgi:hypothetical protein